MRAVVIGDLEVARATCALLAARGADVVHLLRPTDGELRGALVPPADAVAVLVRGDVAALRYALLVEHLRPGIRLVVTVFDRTLTEQLVRVVPNCEVKSPADIAVPSIAAACLADGTLAVDFTTQPPRRLVRAQGRLELVPIRDATATWRRYGLLGRLDAHDDATRILMLGFTGLLLVLLTDWAISGLVLHDSLSSGLYAATRVVTTVGPGDADVHRQSWYIFLSSGLMLLTIVLTAIFTAGVVNRVLSNRSLALVGVRVPPRRNHVVIVGLGQVGLRLALAIRQLGARVLVVERDIGAGNARLARSAGIPVLVGNADDIAVLRRAGLSRARALAAMSALDLDNVEVAITALALAPDIPMVLRAGEDDIIAETRSLFRIGDVCDVSALTAAAVATSMQGMSPTAVFAESHRVVVYDGVQEITTDPAPRCTCPPG